MQRKGGRGKRGEEFDVEAVLDELYTMPPPGFVARREELAAAARTAGRAEDSRRIRAARRPTLAAWAANLLLRREPDDSRRLLELGEGLREAYRTLDPAALKDLSAQRRRVVATLARRAAGLADAAGHRLSAAAQQDVAATLHAVLADPGAAEEWATGRLTGALSPPSDFGFSGPDAATATVTLMATAAARPKTARTAEKPAKRIGKKAAEAAGPTPEDELAERRRIRREQLAKARQAAEEAEQRLRDRRVEAAEAAESLTRAGERRDEARRETEAAERRLRAAREAWENADRAHREAEERHRSTTDARTAAEREARTAAQEVRRLAGRTGRRA
ncbi:hypothetical protein [Streptomyces sp.]|uniref:hypothetical protein n=1 Tax=Streptomyces sp. TaxID=1931 RepID=UPI002D75DEB0|nr:hypothetical protein [Streptomyces sp.]HZF92231.1 hypothetical protein [Streptomyces sp.]